MKISSAGYPSMGVTEVEMEKVLRGSREGFSDSVKINSALIRKRLQGYQIKGSGILYWGEITYTGSDGIHGRSGAGGISGTGERAVGRVSS